MHANHSRQLERFQEKWTRFSVRKRDQRKILEHFDNSIDFGNALVGPIAGAFLAAAICFVGAAHADQTDDRLEELFETLGDTDDSSKAHEVQLEISNIWQEPDSASIELLMNRSISAVNEQDFDTARVHLNDIVNLAPDFAEGWNQRAILNFMTDRYDEAILDIQKTVSLEPRHYGAWSGLGQIFESVGNGGAALQAYRQALSVNPHLEGAERAIKRLETDVEGQGI